VVSAWDTCASHNFISTRLAAECIAAGSQYERCALPIRQGEINAGVSRIRMTVDLVVVHQGRVLRLDRELFYVWDMGSEATLCCSLLEDERLLEGQAALTDEVLLDNFVSRRGEFSAGEDEGLLLEHLRERRSLVDVSLAKNPASLSATVSRATDFNSATETKAQEQLDKEAEDEIRKHLSRPSQATRASMDGYKFEEILELRRTLLRQLRTPVEDVKRRLEEIKSLYPEAFGEDISKPCSLRKFEIKLKDGYRIYCFLPRRVSEPVLADMKEQIANLVSQGVIEECLDSPFAFPIVMAKRPGSSKLRLCVDYSLQNEQTLPLPFPIPDAKEQLDRLSGKKFYFSLDCSKFFHEFEIVPESRDFTAFVVPWGRKYRWTRVPFGLRNSPSHCQREFQQLLASNGLDMLVPYYDDVAYGSNDADDLCEKFERLLRLAVTFGLKFKEDSKLILGHAAINHLGFVCNSEGVHIHPDRVVKLLRLPKAGNVDELRHILGSFTYVRAWLSDAATMSAPLTDLLKKNVGWHWSAAQDEALDNLKEAAITARCLAGTLDPSLPICIATDASLIGVAAVIFQLAKNEQGRELPRVLAYAHRRFTAAEVRWTANIKEAYGLKFAFEKFGSLILGYDDVTVLTDHKNSLWLHQSTDPKVTRWRLYLNRWRFKIQHIAGKDNLVSDALSRLHFDNLYESAPSIAEGRLQRMDPMGADEDDDVAADRDICSAMFNRVVGDVVEYDFLDRYGIGSSPARLQSATGERGGVVRDASQRILENLSKVANRKANTPKDVVCEFRELDDSDMAFRSDMRDDEVGLICSASLCPARAAAAPQPQDLAIDQLHPIVKAIGRVHNAEVGHMGTFVTYRRLRNLQDCCWGLSPTQLKEAVVKYVKACPQCQKMSTMPSPWRGQRFIRQRPFFEISIDVLEMPYPDVSGARKVLTVLCSFTRAIELFPLESADAQRVAECLFAVRNRYGPMSVVRVDNAKAFVGAVVKLLMRLLGSRVHNVTAAAHWENGQCERSHRSVLRHLRHLVLADVAGANSQRSWSTLLSSARRIMMNTINPSTGETPNSFVFGGFADTEEDMIMSNHAGRLSRSEDPQGFVGELQEEQISLFARAEEYQNSLLSRLAARAESEGERVVEEGAWVLAYRGGLPHGRECTKLQYRWTGPWRVLDRPDGDSHPRVQCMHAASKRVESFNIAELRAFDSSLLASVEDFERVAERDMWDYSVDSILSHEPRGPRGRRAKSSYKFEVLYKYLERSDEPGQENPAWQPYSAIAHTEALQRYCAQESVRADLGANFFVANGQ
jgi:hypothetical protein